MNTLEIPIRDSQEILSIPQSELPPEADSLLSILSREECSLNLYKEASLMYWRVDCEVGGSGEECLRVLRAALDIAVGGERLEFVVLLACVLATLVMRRDAFDATFNGNGDVNAGETTSPLLLLPNNPSSSPTLERESKLEECTRLLNEAESLDSQYSMLLLGKSALLMQQGRHHLCIPMLKALLKQVRESASSAPPSPHAVNLGVLGVGRCALAISEYINGDYQAALSALPPTITARLLEDTLDKDYVAAMDSAQLLCFFMGAVCLMGGEGGDESALRISSLLCERMPLPPTESSNKNDEINTLTIAMHSTRAHLLLDTHTLPDTLKALAIFKAIWKYSPKHPPSLFHLSNALLNTGKVDKAAGLLCSSPFVRAKCLHSRLDGSTENGALFDDAIALYGKAVGEEGINHANLLMAQLWCLKGEWAVADECIERFFAGCCGGSKNIQDDALVEMVDMDAEYWLMAAFVKMKKGNRDDDQSSKVVELYLNKALASFHDGEDNDKTMHYNALCALASLPANISTGRSAELFEQASAIDEKSMWSDPMMLCNWAVSRAALQKRNCEADVSVDTFTLELFAASLKLVVGEDEGTDNASNKSSAGITSEQIRQLILFNQAQYYEDCGRATEARDIYSALEGNAGALFRLGILQLQQHKHTASNGSGESVLTDVYFKEAIGLNEQYTEAWQLLACTHLRARALGPARKAYERILKTINKHDPLSLCALGSLNLAYSRSSTATDATNKDDSNCSNVNISTRRKREYLARALEFYCKALTLMPTNWCAAYGVGCVLAELGEWQDALRIMVAINSASFTHKDVNDDDHKNIKLALATCLLECSQGEQALKVYDQLLKSRPAAGEGEEEYQEITLLKCRALFVCAHSVGDDEDEGPRKATAKDTSSQVDWAHLQQAILLLSNLCPSHPDSAEEDRGPSDARIAFNLALCKQDLVNAFLKSSGRGKSVPFSLEIASNHIDDAISIYTSLAQPSENENLLKLPAKQARQLSKRIKHCKYAQAAISKLVAKRQQADALAKSPTAQQSTSPLKRGLDAVRAGREAKIKQEQAAIKEKLERERAREEEAKRIRAEMRAKFTTEMASAPSSPSESDDDDDEHADGPSADADIKRKTRKRTKNHSNIAKNNTQQKAKTPKIDNNRLSKAIISSSSEDEASGSRESAHNSDSRSEI